MDLVLPHIGLIARSPLGLDMLALITLLSGADREARSGGMVGQNGTAITSTDKDRIAVYGGKTVLFGALLILRVVLGRKATASLRAELQGRYISRGRIERQIIEMFVFIRQTKSRLKCVPTLAGDFGTPHVRVRRRLVEGIYSHRPTNQVSQTRYDRRLARWWR